MKSKPNKFVRIENSKIHGSGGFAKRNIKRGTRLIEYIGKKITKEEADKILDKEGVFVFEVNEEWDIDGNVPENTARFINHSCSPNCSFDIKNNRIWIKSRKAIKKDEELTYNYGFDLEGYKKYPCKCSSENCIGYILDKKHWKKVKIKFKKPVKKKTRVLVAMSGGVDSSVAAFLMKKQGYEVIGAFMKNWSDTKNEFGECKWKDDRKVAMKIASQLGIPLITLDFEKQYRKDVIDEMFKLYRKGITPNPDVDCNNKVKFPLLWKEAKKLGADLVVTGHYARIREEKNKSKVNVKTASLVKNNLKVQGLTYSLLRAKDESKDQSYFLYRLNQKDLSHSYFPIGDYTKKNVRAIAEKQGFTNFDRKSTVGICFVGKVNLKDFLKVRIKPKKGKILNPEGKVIGQHDGIYYYTLGQRLGPRFGLEINKNNDDKKQLKRWYVASKNLKKNEIVAAPEGHPLLFRKEVIIKNPHWINEAPKKNIKVLARIRQVGELLTSKLHYDKGKKHFHVSLSKSITGISEGQAIVLYSGTKVLGGGVICF
ncbi:MAG: tRNA 2-thiouridine(34) synthase MnmA [Nanoarchaeota archaeon]